jgi:hypothetical protein
VKDRCRLMKETCNTGMHLAYGLWSLLCFDTFWINDFSVAYALGVADQSFAPSLCQLHIGLIKTQPGKGL